ncbi:MAG: hypothetical protein ABUT20_19460, partial [Bacteroidota bacterium]
TNPEHNSILVCFDTYINCINDQYKRPTIKDKIFSYFDALERETKAERRNYLDNELFDINHENLQPLRNFLVNFFS